MKTETETAFIHQIDTDAIWPQLRKGDLVSARKCETIPDKMDGIYILCVSSFGSRCALVGFMANDDNKKEKTSYNISLLFVARRGIEPLLPE